MARKSLVRGAMSVMFVLSTALVAPGCGDDDEGDGDLTLSQVCNATASTLCTQIYKCTSEADRSLLALFIPFLGKNAQECTSNVRDLQCSQAPTSCPQGKTFNGAAARRCLDALEAATCEDLPTDGSLPEEPEDCDEVALCQ